MQQVELVPKLFSASAMKVPKYGPWCGTTVKWYELLIPYLLELVTYASLLRCLGTLTKFACVYVKAREMAWTQSMFFALQNSDMYSQNVEVIKGDVYQYMTLPAAMNGW